MQNGHAFVLILNGPPDNGQAPTVQALLRNRLCRFHVSTNRVKFCISDYSAERTDREMLNRMVFALAAAARREGHSLVVDGSTTIMRGWRTAYAELAKATGSAFLEVNIEAPYEILLERFTKRVAKSEAEGTKISIREEADLEERFAAYHHLKNPALPTFDSSVLTPDQIAGEIELLLTT